MRLAIEPDLLVVGEAADGVRAVELAVKLQPDVVLMDLRLPDLDGLGATSAIRRLAPHSAVVVLTLYSDPPLRARADEAGAAALVEKCAGGDALLAAIRRAANGAGTGSG